MIKKRTLKITILILFRVILLFAVLSFISEKNYYYVFLTFTTLILTFLPSILEKKLKVDYPEEFELIILAFIFGAMFLGEIHSFYYKYWWWDIALHGLSAIILGILAFSLVYILNKEGVIKLRPGFIAIFAFCFAVAGGALWEIFEFGVDFIFLANMQKSGLVDTMTDIIIDTTGALIIALIGFFYAKGRLSFLRFLENDFVNSNPIIF